MNIYRHNAIVKVFRGTGNPTEDQVFKQAENQERLKDFIINLYEGRPFKINDMVNFDETNYGMAIWTLTNIYPSEDFYQRVKKIK